ncbi:MAG: RagB/SusD family nutrient uptake outer membrane protein [Bacteroidales bacterium]|nr:RagB/SusD family nutrient uptake outer membrane protein [Bacteroidales bacterium]MBP5235473.1 RagB/SusD family nutrient uptake outer membrane protein [Bacteroidales bacterium]MBP5740625.1 RagB/SusD family nutrient uptake outer membrane protein [Bacteroidales bacterium]
MKRLSYIAISLLFLVFTGCEGFLDTDNLVKKDTKNFPITEVDAEQAITAMYAVMNNGLTDPESDPFFVFELAGDDRLGGGSQSNVGSQSLDRLMNWEQDAFDRFWETRYKGIFAANTFLSSVDNIKGWSNENVKNRTMAETYFLRGFYFFQLAQVFGHVPIRLGIEKESLTMAEPEDIYAQIASDLKTAINLFPSVKYPECGIGHASKWVAEGIMARVWMFYTGYYKKDALPLVDGGSVTKDEVIAWIEDCIKNSGHDLLPDQRSLWPYTNPYTVPDYPYASENGLEWATDENVESMFAVKFSNKGSFDDQQLRHNRVVEFFNPRKAGATSFPFNATGYSNGPVCSALWLDWDADPDYAGDYRRVGSIIDRAAEIPDYAGDTSKEVENTGLLSKKYIGVGAKADGKTYESYAFMYGGENNKQTGLTQALIWLRFADVLLMHAELTDGKVIYNGKNGLNAVRERAGLPDVAYSLEALKKERRYELCFEALRWNDLRRWGDVEVIVSNQEGNAILNQGKEGNYAWSKAYPFMTRYQQTGGFFKIPEGEIIRTNGELVQNPGWEDEYNFAKGDLPYYKK